MAFDSPDPITPREKGAFQINLDGVRTPAADGQRLGPMGKVLGVASGVALGTVGGLYMGYEAAEAMESSVKIRAYEERFDQFKKGVTTDDSDPSVLGLGQTLTQKLPFGWERK